jgi:hypothetical protein
MNQFNFSETGYIEIAESFRDFLERETSQVTDQAGLISMKERVEEKLNTIHDLLPNVPTDQKRRVEVLLTGLRWDCNYALRDAEDCYRTLARIRPAIAVLFNQAFGTGEIFVKG